MSEHLTAEQVRDFILGVEGDLPAATARDHLAECADCAAVATDEAELDQALWELRQDAPICPTCDRVADPKHRPLRCDHCGAAIEAGRYRVISVLVQTGHGRLYLAEDGSGRRLALKEVVFAQVPELEVLQAFEREATILKQLDHPQIPKLIDSFQEGEGVSTRIYLVQEYVEGISLLRRMELHRYSEQEVKQIAAQVLRVLAYLQSLAPPVFHRDIKPANLIQKPDGRVVMVDFGAARNLGSTQGATLVGTYGYMPSEQLGGIVDKTTDLYALGASLAQLLSRRPPWELLGREQMWRRVEVSRAFLRYLQRLAHPDPGKRFADATEALDALGLLPQPQHPRRAWRRFAVAAAAVVAIGLPTGIALHNLWPEPQGAHGESDLPIAGPAMPAGWEYGDVVIRTHPTGAKAWLDEKPLDATTPIHVGGITLDTRHVVRIEKSGFHRQKKFFTLSEAQRRLELEVKLKPIVDAMRTWTERERVLFEERRAEVNAHYGARISKLSAGSEELLRELWMQLEVELLNESYSPAQALAALERIDRFLNREEMKRRSPNLSDKQDAQHFYDEGNRLAVQGNSYDAMFQFKLCVRADPSFAEAYRGLGITHARLGEAEQAKNNYRRYLRLRPKARDAERIREILASFEDVDDRGSSHGKERRSQEEEPNARTEAEQPTTGDPKAGTSVGDSKVAERDQVRARAHYDEGNRLILQGRSADAVEQFRDSLKADPSLAEAHRGLGISYARLGKADLAVKHYQSFLDARPDDPDAERVREMVKVYREH